MARAATRIKNKPSTSDVSQPIRISSPVSGIRDNHIRGSVGDFLRDKIQPGCTLSVISAYFTIYAFEALKAQLNDIASLRFLFGEPRFLKSLDPDRTDKKSFKIEDDGLQLANRLEQKRVAKECAAWITDKVQIRSIKQANLLHGKVWYEIVRMQTEAAQNWLYHELYLGTSPDGYELPVHRGHGKGWPDLLKQARKHLADNDERAAAVYARAAFEGKLQRYCEKNAIPVRYHSDPRRIEAQSFWDAVKKRLQDEGKFAAYQPIISQIETFRKIVLNPLSHATPTTVTRPEIQGAIDAVAALNL